MGPVLFFIYINGLPNELKTNVKLFADDMSLFTTVKYISKSANALNNALSLVWKWAFNWKMLFNPNPSTSPQGMLFSRKNKLQIHPTINLNNIQVIRASYQKHLGILLYEKLNFKQHVDNAIMKVNKGISVIKKIEV